jgi:hypothetical protein
LQLEQLGESLPTYCFGEAFSYFFSLS